MDHMGNPPGMSAGELGLSRLDYHVRVNSTMDEAHAAASAGAPAGTLVVASTQNAGRGRGGKHWVSAPDAGLWCTLLERPADASALEVLALRVGLALADALQPHTDGAIGLKWPNDLLVGARKLAGILIEVRWRDGRPEWVAIGVGINRVVPSDLPTATSIRHGVSRDALLHVVAPALRRAAAQGGPLTEWERRAWRERDVAVGRRISSPAHGVVRGVTADGALEVIADDGTVRFLHSGSLLFAGDASDAPK
jgi:BirA family transcriptional regulator, biotin operon repressor / biotin---[acetyl-CoA-carboxylase] ligase